MTQALLAPSEPQPFTWENETGKAPVIIVCDHASNRIPASLGGLGVHPSELQRHIAYDPGTETIGRALAHALDAPVIFANYSRLVIDLNRHPAHPTAMPEISDHTSVPANHGLTDFDRAARIDTLFTPYHASIAQKIDSYTSRGVTPALIAVHSFTPVMNDIIRPWEIGILWWKDERISVPLIDALRRNNPDFTVGDNEPYAMNDDPNYGYTTAHHALKRGLPFTCVEFRQDLVMTDEDAEKFAVIFLESLQPILQDAALYRPLAA